MHQPFIRSIRPVNLLSFGPETQEIELRPLNILIGPNGCGKSNFIEIISLLRKLTDRDPWSEVIDTGGALEWIWKDKSAQKAIPGLSLVSSGENYPVEPPNSSLDLDRLFKLEQKPTSYSITLREKEGGFEVATEQFRELDRWKHDPIQPPWLERDGWLCQIHNTSIPVDSSERFSSLSPQRPVLSFSRAGEISARIPHIQKLADKIEKTAIHRDWAFGSRARVRALQPVGLDSSLLERDYRNLAQVLKAWRDRGDQIVFERLIELMQTFYSSVKDVDVELVGSYLQIIIREMTGFKTPATRLSDGTLRWLILLVILLDPVPPPLICIDEPELGLHPDILPTLADLLRDASTRTQLILTTHSRDLVECFSDDADSVCVCEKVAGSTRIERLDSGRLKVWLEKYSLGQLWASGEIGGNRW